MKNLNATVHVDGDRWRADKYYNYGNLVEQRPVADRMGRLAMMKLSATLFFICGLGAGLASSIWMFVIFHAIGGIGLGFGSVAAPAYIAEIR